ncbi:MAG: hypothetical protein UZ21_OP11001000476 [Microgenomates bacterium OLB22]|nr:MAG: hypothetical protein UZ21_OP11001000476 [Microgenomates bacterium OLB22]
MTQKDISIEYAHIYTNNRIDEEQKISVTVLNSVLTDLRGTGQTTSLVLLVDDYSFPDPTFDYDALVAWLTEEGFKPDVLLRESQLIPLCDLVLNKVTNQNIKENLVDYIKAKKYPCSLFIATWYLLRLGYIEWGLYPKEYHARKLLNILPKSFEPFELQGLEIIANTEFGGAVSQIEYKYLEGRLIA